MSSNFSLNIADVDKYLHTDVTQSMFLFPTNFCEIFNSILSLKNIQSVGPDCIPSRILKLSAETLSAPLAHVINMSFSKGIFPDALKIAKVIPIHKKGKHDSVDNYRPISLLSNIGKVFEKVIYTRTIEYLNKNCFLFEN